MNQYLLSIYQPAGAPPPKEDLDRVMARVGAVIDEATKAGVLVLNAGLAPPATGRVVRLKQGGTVVTDGPFAETKEYLGGFAIVRASDLESALGWARKLASALTVDGRDGLPVEVRALQEHS